MKRTNERSLMHRAEYLNRDEDDAARDFWIPDDMTHRQQYPDDDFDPFDPTDPQGNDAPQYWQPCQPTQKG